MLGCAIWIGAYLQSFTRSFMVVAVAAVLLLLLRAPTARVFIAALVVGAIVMSIRLTSLQMSEINHHFGERVEYQARVRSDPLPTQSKVRGNTFVAKKFSFLATTPSGPIRIISSDEKVLDLLPGQKIEVTGTLQRSNEYRVGGVLFARRIKAIAPPSAFSKILGDIRTGLSSAAGDGDIGALIPGMVIGDTRKQSSDFKSDMRRAGLTHLVAVSGANFAIVASFVLWLAQFLFRTKRPRIIATAFALAGFIALVRPSPSVLRAAAMAAVTLFAHATYRRGDAIPALGVAIAAVIIIDPWQSRDAGFALSVLATAGLLLLTPRLKLPQVIAIPIAAMAFCLPIIISLSGYFSPASLAANIFAAPFVAPITIVGFVAALISPLSPWLAKLILNLIKPLAFMITWIARRAATFPVLTVKTGWIATFAIMVGIVAIYLYRRSAIVVIALLIIITSHISQFPQKDWQIYSCDVGQGDATVLNLHHHRAIVIDTGPDPALMDNCLRSLGISEIPLLVLTHPHADHIGGFSGAIKNRKVGTIWSANVAAGTRATIGEYQINVLWPLTIGAIDENPNNVSIALKITTHDFTLFAAGDIEPPVQEQLRGKVGHVDIYKVAHHGSKYQDPILLRELSPKVALIEVGKDNSYGHPSPTTIAALRALGAKVYRTDKDGALAVAADDHSIIVDYDNAHIRWLRWR